MRLLERNDAGEILLTEDFREDKIPPYAVLSHTWGSDEVLLKDLADGKAVTKLGYKKIQFCGDQAQRDGLRHFWVDTCCIDKTSSAELQEAISCMFSFYRDAVKCYVYLADVSRLSSDADNDDDADDGPSPSRWKTAFRKSRWFTRGWTLQELIAPATVEFFSKEGVQLGSKHSLEESIHEITGIPRSVLQGSPLSDSTVEQRMEWIQNRETTRKEDKAYSLLGLFDVHMCLIYGEGREKAFKRLLDEIEKGSKGKEAGRDVNEEFAMGFKLPGVTPVDRFVAREEELTKLHDALSKGTDRRTAVVDGLGGMGKTQLSVEYAKRHQRDYSAVFWLNARDTASLKQAFAQVAERILHELPPVAYIKNAVDSHDLDEAGPSSGDGDAVADGYDIRKFLPDAYHGAVVITTRSSRIQFGQRIHLKKLQDIKDSLEILSHTSGRQDLQKDAAAVELAQNLDGLPLALSTAGAYLCNMPTTCAEYIQMYSTSWLRLQQTTPKLDSYNRTLYSTWDISYAQVKSQNATSAMLLQLWAHFDHEDLWFELLQQGRPRGPLWFQNMTEDIIEFNKAARVLCDYGLAEADTSSKEYGTESRGYSIHSCVHAWAIHVLNKVKNDTSAWLAITCISSKLPENTEREYWVMQRRLIRHGAYCLAAIMDDIPVPGGEEWILQKLGDLFLDQDRRDDAEAMYDRALQRKEKALGPDHTSTLDTISSLGNLYRLQGRLNKAEAMHDRALQGREHALGPDHASTLYSAHNLGSVYWNQGRLHEAEAMYSRALQGRETALGPDHTSTLQTANNLGNLYAEQDRLDEAEAMYNRALQGKEKVLGPDHTLTIRTVSNLGILYKKRGQLHQAEAMYNRAIQGHEKAFGPDHTSTLMIVNNLGIIYVQQDRLGEAEAMCNRALHGQEKVLGPNHRSTIATLNTLGIIYMKQGQLHEAEAKFDRSLRVTEKLFGPDHTSTLDTVIQLGSVYLRQGRLHEAEAMYNRGLQGKKKSLGPDHTSTLTVVSNLAVTYEQQGRLDEAEAMFDRALRGHQKALTDKHVNISVSALDNVEEFAKFYIQQGKISQGRTLYMQYQESFKAVFGVEHARYKRVTKALESLGENCQT